MRLLSAASNGGMPERNVWNARGEQCVEREIRISQWDTSTSEKHPESKS